MKVMPSTLAPFLRSETQGALLAEILLGNAEHTITELATAADTSPATVTREVDRLVAAGYATERHVGRARLISANTQHPLYQPLKQIISYTYGPVPILHGLLESQTDIDQALIFGSWAERASGVPGHDPNDIDVLAVGKIRPRAAAALANQATDLLGKEVNIRVYSREDWTTRSDGFLREILRRPTIDLQLHDRLAAG
jgi:DNA-binding transcriptional ArsR family regulator